MSRERLLLTAGHLRAMTRDALSACVSGVAALPPTKGMVAGAICGVLVGAGAAFYLMRGPAGAPSIISAGPLRGISVDGTLLSDFASRDPSVKVAGAVRSPDQATLGGASRQWRPPARATSDADHRAPQNHLAVSVTPVVLIVDSDGGVDADLSARVAVMLHGYAAAFPPAFVRDGRFDQAFRGDGSILRGLGFSPQTSVLLGVNQAPAKAGTISSQQNRSTIRVRIREYFPPDYFSSRTLAVEATGTGDSTATAAQRATDLAATQLVQELAHSRRSVAERKGAGVFTNTIRWSPAP